MNPITLSPTALRRDLFNVLDQVVATHQTVEIERQGHILVISEKTPESGLKRYFSGPKRCAQQGTDEALLTPSWDWTETGNLA